MAAKDISTRQNVPAETNDQTKNVSPDEKPFLPYGGKVFSIYTSAAKEPKFAKSEDPELPFKAMGTFWAILLGLAMVMTSILVLSHRAVVSPSTNPPNLMIQGSKF